MAECEKSSYSIIDTKSELNRSLSEIKSNSKDFNTLAVDCEGINLSRTGQLTILSIATKEKVYIFDVLKLGKSGFDDGLRDILEDKSIDKLMFDCRQDADSLWHQFHVKISGILDLQLAEILYRRQKNLSRWDIVSKSMKRNQMVDEVENIHGYQKCLGLYVRDAKIMASKEKGKHELDRDGHIWKKRPLTETLAEYCYADVMGLFCLHEELKLSEDVMPRLRVASERYADRYRSMTERNFDKFECNAYLPLRIIPEKGTLDFPAATTPCIKCHRKFPHDEFLPSQLNFGHQKCCVCRRKEIDLARNAKRSFRY